MAEMVDKTKETKEDVFFALLEEFDAEVYGHEISRESRYRRLRQGIETGSARAKAFAKRYEAAEE